MRQLSGSDASVIAGDTGFSYHYNVHIARLWGPSCVGIDVYRERCIIYTLEREDMQPLA